MDYMTIKQITKHTEDWTAKVIVAEKCSPKISQETSIRYQPMVLMDLEGTTIRATIYEQHIAPLSNTLLLGQTYLISNARVKDPPPKYCKFPGELQWTISGTCNVTEVQDTHLDLVFSRINLRSFDSLNEVKNKKIPISIMAMVIAVKPMRPAPSKTGEHYMIRDIILMDKSFETINMRLSSSYPEYEGQELLNSLQNYPIIIAKDVVVTTYDGLALSPTNDTCVYIDVPFEEVLAYKKWIEDNKEAITGKQTLRQYLTPKKVEASEDTITSPIKDTIELPIKEHCWIKATAKVKRTSRPYWYMACSNCFTAASIATAGQNYSCRYCTETNATAVPRARVEVELFDNTETISASIIGRPAEDFLNATAAKLMGLTRANMNIQESIRLDIDEDHLFYIKAVASRPWSGHRGKAPYSANQIPAKKFEVVAIDEYDPAKHKNITIEKIAQQTCTANTSTQTSETTDITTSTPAVKRALFADDTTAIAKKKVHAKMD